ncbi:MAG: branched-chain amino acid ABC transporter permease [Clostridiales bacterium]|jgi:branched-chain amino acid transport system permease protein|nr:branched-chain amino acid ABC transporter permease [Clostridiales bacterium]
MFEMFVSHLINGLQIGSIYALIALGYTMVYGIVKLINFAHGDVIMVGAFIILFLVTGAGIPFIPAVLTAMAGCALLGVLMEKIAYKPLRNATRLSALITAIGVSLFLQNAFLVRFSPNPRPFPRPAISGSLNLFGDVSISYLALVTIVVSAVMMILLHFFVKGTKMGKAMRAVSEDSGAACLMGINVNNTIAVTFAVGSALAAVGSALYASTYPQVEPFMGLQMGLKAFVAAVLGGIGIIPGAMLGGILLGIVESMTKAYISTQLSDAVVYGILIIVLLLKPSGLMGKTTGEKV